MTSIAGAHNSATTGSVMLVQTPADVYSPNLSAHGSEFTVILPFFNEEAFIADTLFSLEQQNLRPPHLILVDNGSTDSSADICRTLTARWTMTETQILEESKPGKVHALRAALNRVKTDYVALCDADTLYPYHYFELAFKLFEQDADGIVAVMALGVGGNPYSKKSILERLKGSLIARLLAKQCHSGGFGQIFRTKALTAAGGFSEALWPFVLEDHEVIQRVLKHGRCRYHPDLWCQPSARRTDRSNVSWNTFEQVVYHCTPFHLKDWYFQKFLARRFEKRGLKNANLREKNWQSCQAESKRGSGIGGGHPSATSSH